MEMKRISLFFAILFVGFGLKAQQGCECSSAEEYGLWIRDGLIGAEYNNPVTGYKGNQYLQDWTYGDVKLINGEVIREVILRYDRYSDDLLWLRKGDYRKGVLNKEIITGFVLRNDWNKTQVTFTKRKIDLPWLDSTEVFLQVMVEGPVSMYVYRKVKEEAVQYNLIDNTKYIIEYEGKDHVIALRRKSLLELPFIVKAEMKKVIRRNRIHILNNESGMAMAIDFYNRERGEK
jgi:hypothetical protein